MGIKEILSKQNNIIRKETFLEIFRNVIEGVLILGASS